MAVYRRYLRQSEGFGAFSASGDRYEIVKSAPAEAAHGSAGAPVGRFLRIETGKTTARRRAPRSGARPRISSRCLMLKQIHRSFPWIFLIL